MENSQIKEILSRIVLRAENKKEKDVEKLKIYFRVGICHEINQFGRLKTYHIEEYKRDIYLDDMSIRWLKLFLWDEFQKSTYRLECIGYDDIWFFNDQNRIDFLKEVIKNLDNEKE